MHSASSGRAVLGGHQDIMIIMLLAFTAHPVDDCGHHEADYHQDVVVEDPR